MSDDMSMGLPSSAGEHGVLRSMQEVAIYLAAEANPGAMVCSEEVVVNGFRNSHDAALVTDFLHIFTNLIAGIHRVVAAIIEEVAHVVLLEDFQDALIIGVIHIGISQLVAAGTQSSKRGVYCSRSSSAGSS